MEACARAGRDARAAHPRRVEPDRRRRSAGGAAPDAAYWRRHLREPVRFADGIASLHRDGYRDFPRGRPAPDADRAGAAVAARSTARILLTSLRRGKDDWHELMHSLAALYVRGARVDWAGVDRPYGIRARRCRPIRSSAARSGSHRRHRARIGRPPCRAAPHALLGASLATAVPIFETMLSAQRPAYLGEHRVQGAALVAGPVFLEMAQACAHELRGPANRAVEQFVIREPLVLPEAGRMVQLHFAPEPDGALPFSVHSRTSDGSGDWQLHATGRLVSATAASAYGGAQTPLHQIEQALGAASPCDPYYEKLAGLGIQLGRVLPQPQAGTATPPRGAGVAGPAAGMRSDAVCWAHPGLLDGALQAVGLCVPQSEGGSEIYLLTEIDRVELAGPLPAQLLCHARLHDAHEPQPAQWRADVTLRANDGTVLGVIHGATLRRASRDALSRAVGAASDNGSVLPGRLGTGAGVAACIHDAAGAGAVHAARTGPVRIARGRARRLDL